MSSFLRSLWRSNSKHKKLCEEWALASSCESVGPSTSSSAEVVSSSAPTSASTSASSSRTGPDEPDLLPETSFELKYFGCTPVESPSSEKETAHVIKTIVCTAKASGKKLQRVSLAVSLRGIRMTDLTTGEEQLRISIYSISYCSADGAHGNVFGFIAANPEEILECHAYLCPKRKVAQTVTLAVAQSFNAAYELWQLAELDTGACHPEPQGPQLSNGNGLADEDGHDEQDEGHKKGAVSDEKSPEERRKCKGSLRGRNKSSSHKTNVESKVDSSLKNRDSTFIDVDGVGFVDSSMTCPITFDENHFTSADNQVSFEDETSGARNGMPMKPLNNKSPTPSPSLATSTTSINDSTSTAAEQTQLIASTWTESETSRKLDLVCSS
ncbi:uncharacterized protein LOC106636533 [Copidosoma floridanum]|uniref:uncharacterized protein LOC106636533 n=1 Tax=Copidosoma floridanum TaxID=29053 RepID=UPI000C6FA23A|nr:uncharacterized protein LOC106636533 [Copidosoma floridanum]